MILIVLVKQIRGLHTVAQPVRKAGPPNCQWEALDLSEAWCAMHEVHGRARDCVCSHILAFGGVVYEDMRSRVQQDRALMENKYPRVSLAP